MFSAVFCCFVIRGLQSASALSVGMFSSSASSTHSVAMLLPFGCGRAAGACDIKARETERSRDEGKARLSGRFLIGSAPLTSITEADAQISGGGKPNRTIKISGVSPWWLPRCALLFLPFGLPVSFRQLWPRLSHLPRLDTPVPGRQFASSWTVSVTNPPVQSDRCA